MFSSSRRSGRRRRADAFTLMELLLVVAIMVAVLAVGWPMLRQSFRTQRLKKGGERIQAEWAKARNRAIRTGRVHVFQHAVYSDQFVTTAQPSVEDDWQTEPGDAVNPVDQSLQNPNSRLPEGVVFLGADVRLDQRTSFEITNLVPLSTMPAVASVAATQEATGQIEWGTPIFFFPDGTTSTALLVLADDQQRSISISLRGLTGSSRRGPIEAVSEFAGGAR